MTDLLAKGNQWLEQTRHASCSSPVTYRRGTVEDNVDATLGETRYEFDDLSGIRTGGQVIDFLILATAFPHDKPERGDKIITAAGTVYEVMPFGSDGDWRWSDPYRNTFRIHTREVDSE